MKVKEFTRFHSAPEFAIKLLSQEIHSFLKKDSSIEIISISHSIIDSQSTNDDERFMASALLCFK